MPRNKRPRSKAVRTPQTATWGADLSAFADTHISRMCQGCSVSLAISPTELGRVQLYMINPHTSAMLWNHEFNSFDALMTAMDARAEDLFAGAWAGVPPASAKAFGLILQQSHDRAQSAAAIAAALFAGKRGAKK